MLLYRKIIWCSLGVAGTLQLVLLASQYNLYFTAKPSIIGQQGPVLIQLSNESFHIVSNAVVVLAAVAMALSGLKLARNVYALLTTTIGSLLFSSLFARVMYTGEAHWLWAIAICGTIALALYGIGSALNIGIFKKGVVPDRIPQHEDIHH